MQLSKNFILQELIPPEIYNHPAIGDRSVDFINCNTTNVLEKLRELFGPITINNWHTGGIRHDSGFRAPDSETGAKYSAHRMGTGFDLKFSKSKPVDVYLHILNNQSDFPYISRMENAEITGTWLHIEICTNKRDGDIVIFNP